MKLIVAVDKNWGIGKSNGLLFSIPEDMNFFRKTTTGKVVCMGYNTLLSFPGSKPLKNRVNIVLAPDGVERDDCIIVHTLGELFKTLENYDTDDRADQPYMGNNAQKAQKYADGKRFLLRIFVRVLFVHRHSVFLFHPCDVLGRYTSFPFRFASVKPVFFGHLHSSVVNVVEYFRSFLLYHGFPVFSSIMYNK